MSKAELEPCIVGIGETEYRRWGGMGDQSELRLACLAIVNAARDAGLPIGNIDGIASYANDRNEPSMLQDALGLPRLRFVGMVWGGGGAGSCGALAQAAAAIRSGSAHYVVVVRALCQGQSRRFGKFSAARPGNNFMAPFGMFAPSMMLAPLVQRYMHLHGATSEHLGEIALVCRDNATRNPRAVMKDRPLTMSSYLASRVIAAPFRLNDCCQENDGACALIVTSRERARDLAGQAVHILAAEQQNLPGWGGGPLATHNMPVDDYASAGSRAVAERVYAAAGVIPDDIDVAQIYDHFTGMVLMSLEDYGFCGKGEAPALVASGALRWKDGRLPINTAGGHLSEAYIHGLNLVIEGVRQLRGNSTSQVDNARLCLVTGGSGAPFPSAAILGV